MNERVPSPFSHPSILLWHERVYCIYTAEVEEEIHEGGRIICRPSELNAEREPNKGIFALTKQAGYWYV